MKEIKMSFWEIIKNRCKSSRFIVVMAVILLTFIGAIIRTIFDDFPFVLFAGIMNGSGVLTYMTKTLEPGARERRKGENSART